MFSQPDSSRSKSGVFNASQTKPMQKVKKLLSGLHSVISQTMPQEEEESPSSLPYLYKSTDNNDLPDLRQSALGHRCESQLLASLLQIEESQNRSIDEQQSAIDNLVLDDDLPSPERMKIPPNYENQITYQQKKAALSQLGLLKTSSLASYVCREDIYNKLKENVSKNMKSSLKIQTTPLRDQKPRKPKKLPDLVIQRNPKSLSYSLGISPSNDGKKERSLKVLHKNLKSTETSPSPPLSPYKLAKIKSQARMLNSPTQRQTEMAGAVFPVLPQQRIVSHTPHPRALSIPENKHHQHLSMKKRKTRFEPKPGQLVIISQSQKLEKKVSFKKLNLDLFNQKVIGQRRYNAENKPREMQTGTPRSSEISPKQLNRVPSSIERNIQTNSIASHLRSSRNKVRSQKKKVPKLKSQRSTLEIHMNVHEQSLFSNERTRKISRMPSMDSFTTHAKLTRRESDLENNSRTMGDSVRGGMPKLQFLQEYNMGNASHRSDDLSSVRMRNKVYTLIDPGSSQPNT